MEKTHLNWRLIERYDQTKDMSASIEEYLIVVSEKGFLRSNHQVSTPPLTISLMVSCKNPSQNILVLYLVGSFILNGFQMMCIAILKQYLKLPLNG